MTSPAQRHMMRVSAVEAAQRVSDCGDYAQALEHLERAMQLDGHVGVRKEIQKCESALKPKPAAAAKRTTTRPRKAATPAKRGRPRKAVKTAG